MVVRVIVGSALDVLRTLPAESVQLVVTSPPYFQLRRYLDPSDPNSDQELGTEQTPAEFLEALWAVFDEVRRVLRPDGLCFVNIGDSRSGSGKGPTGSNGLGDQARRQGFVNAKTTPVPAKNLLLIPQKFAIGMQDRGWIVRDCVVWAKAAPMPESVRDRMTAAWEPIWMFAKSARYFFDQDAVRQAPSPHTLVAYPNGPGGHQMQDGVPGQSPHRGLTKALPNAAGANLRNVWTLGPSPLREAHFASFTPEIPKRCILAGSRKGDTVLDPFLGSGTTLLVASRLGREGIGIDLNPEYCRLAENRIRRDVGPMFPDEVQTVPAAPSLFDALEAS